MAERDMHDLFGSDSDAEGGSQAPDAAAPAEAEAPAEPAAPANQMHDLFGSDDDEEEGQAAQQGDGEAGARSRSPEAETGPPMLVEVPLHDVVDPATLRLAKLSNILGIEPAPFDATTFEPGLVEYVDDRGKQRTRQKDQSTIRWRWAPDAEGRQVRESNARLVRWSDGSVQLLLGDEVLDAAEIDTGGDHSYLLARHPSLIQGQGQLGTKMVFRPASLASGFHRRLTAQVDRAHTRTNKVRSTTTLADPGKRKEEQERAEDQRIKERERLSDRQARTMRKYAGAGPREPRALSAAYLEEEEDDEGGLGEGEEGEDGAYEDMAAEQRSRLAQRRRGLDEAAEAEAERRLANAKAAPAPAGKRARRIESEDEDEDEDISEEDEEDMGDFIVDEEEEGGGTKKTGGGGGGGEAVPPPAAKKRRGAVVFDSDEDE